MRTTRETLIACLAVAALIGVWSGPRLVRTWAAPGPVAPNTGAPGNESDRAIAYGLLMDSDPPPASVDRGLAIAEALRRKYGIDTGDALRDREEAAARAERELLDPLALDESSIRAMAEDLGYSLEPARCGNTCDNVRELAALELKKRALETYARP